jgi:hypothetical protein
MEGRTSQEAEDRRQTILEMIQARQAEVELHNLFDSRVIQYGSTVLTSLHERPALTYNGRIDEAGR